MLRDRDRSSRTRTWSAGRLLLCALTCAAAASACAGSSRPDATKQPLPSVTAAAGVGIPTATGQTAGPIQVTDAAGQRLEFAAPPRRLVVVGSGPYMSLHLLYMFPTAWERVVGLEKRGTTADDFLPLIDSGFGQKVVLERNPGPEQIAALQPDLVIIKGLWVDELGEALAEVNIPSMYLALESPEQFHGDVHNLGVVLGECERAEEIVAFYQHQLLRLESALGGLTTAEKPRVLLLDYRDRGGTVAVQVPARGWMQTIQVRAAGGIAVWLDAAEWTDGWTVVNLEQIALWNPDQIYVVGVYNLDATEVLGSIRSDPRWKQLAAVQNNELHLVPADLYRWDTPGPRWILGMVWMASQMHPERFAEWDVRQELYGFYGQLYGMDPAAVDEHIVPRVGLDGS